MSEAQAKQHLKDILASFSPGTILHLLGQVIREAEEARLGGLDEVAEERVRDAEACLWVASYGIEAALPR